VTDPVVYLVRHCQAAGQEPAAPLTADGLAQAEALADFLAPLRPDRIVSSPFRRAIASVEPLAVRLGLSIEVDPRLVERILRAPVPPGSPSEDWQTLLRRSFDESDLRLKGGETSREALARAHAALADARAYGAARTVLVSHGNLSALMLGIGFDGWRSLTNPDVFELGDPPARIWR
jgi:2,3-bisphosphoglycerate-dependent phosphoglycerate mutase